MNLSPALKEAYTKEQLSAPDAQRLAEFIAWGPVVFQVSRLMIKFGILNLLRDNPEGLTQQQIADSTKLSLYAVKVLTEASLSIGTVLVDPETERFSLSKTGWFLLTNPITRVNIDFNHDVNYIGLFRLEESLLEGRPAGLEHFGSWATVYEGLSQLPEQVKKSWFGFDHFYSDYSFAEALYIFVACVILNKISIILLALIHASHCGAIEKRCLKQVAAPKAGVGESLVQGKHAHKCRTRGRGTGRYAQDTLHLFIGQLYLAHRKFGMYGFQIFQPAYARTV
jgi:hypothetical protein